MTLHLSPPLPIHLEDFKFCRVEPAPVLDQPNVNVKGVQMKVDYQCAGEPYEQFASLLEALIPKEAPQRSSKWGRRRFPVPRKTGGTTILVLGNSHTRQLVSTLLCHYRHLLTARPKGLFNMPSNPSYGVWKFRMDGGLTIYSATNCPFVYNPHWHRTLEQDILKMPLSKLDAIVLGRINHYTESTGTNFVKIMEDYAQAFPDLHVDFKNSPQFLLQDVAKVYSGPIVYAGMFADYGTRLYEEAVATIRNETNSRQNLAAVDGRKYIAQIETPDHPTVHECASDTRGTVSTCVTDVDSYRFKNGHRCTGSRGGHADLIVWDVVEQLHRLLGGKNIEEYK